MHHCRTGSAYRETMQDIRKRNLTLDLIRILAVLAVVMIHTTSKFVTSYERTSSAFLAGNIFNCLSRVGVPLFLMISGALMLDERRTIVTRDLFRKNIKNILFLLIFWSLLYACVYQVYPPLAAGEAVNWKEFADAAIMGHYHMWYLYMIIGLYVITPFLRTFVKKENAKLVLLFIAVALATQFTTPVLKGMASFWEGAADVRSFLNKFRLSFFGDFTVYYLAGWYIVHVGFDRKWKRYALYLTGILSLLVSFFYVYMTGDHNNGYTNTNLFIFLYSAGLFLALSRIKIKAGKWTGKILVLFSSLSFGVYIIHPLIRGKIAARIPCGSLPAICILERFAATCIISFAACWVISKLPLLKKTMRM